MAEWFRKRHGDIRGPVAVRNVARTLKHRRNVIRSAEASRSARDFRAKCVGVVHGVAAPEDELPGDALGVDFSLLDLSVLGLLVDGLSEDDFSPLDLLSVGDEPPLDFSPLDLPSVDDEPPVVPAPSPPDVR